MGFSSCKYSITYMAVRSSLGYIRSKHNPSSQASPVPFMFMGLFPTSSPSYSSPIISYERLSDQVLQKLNHGMRPQEQRWKAPDSTVTLSKWVKECTIAMKTDEKIKV